VKSEELGLTEADFGTSGMLLALDKLTKVHVPKSFGRTPYWFPKAPPIWKKAHEPEWNWTGPARELYDDATATLLDCNGAFLAPLSGTEMARDALGHTGPLASMTSRQVLPGYYRIGSAPWTDKRIVSPLGQGKIGPQVWVAAPTLVLLLELQEAGRWPEIEIFDSWTCSFKMRMSKWAEWLRGVRLLAMDTDAQWIAQGADPDVVRREGAVIAVKDGYGAAFQMMMQESHPGEPRKSGVFRPDWYQAVRSQHRANMWRKAWKAVQAGIPILSMGTVDEIEIPSDIVIQLIDMPDAPLKIDVTGRQLGSFKVKR
jgi:hypothetical protein